MASRHRSKSLGAFARDATADQERAKIEDQQAFEREMRARVRELSKTEPYFSQLIASDLKRYFRGEKRLREMWEEAEERAKDVCENLSDLIAKAVQKGEESKRVFTFDRELLARPKLRRGLTTGFCVVYRRDLPSFACEVFDLCRKEGLRPSIDGGQKRELDSICIRAHWGT